MIERDRDIDAFQVVGLSADEADHALGIRRAPLGQQRGFQLAPQIARR